MAKIYVVGLGPGDASQMTGAARAALDAADVLCGYTVYLDLVRALYPGKEAFATPMRGELERCRRAVGLARAGRCVAVLCSGDAGVYGMAGLVLQLVEGELEPEVDAQPHVDAQDEVEVEVVSGITAATSGAAVLGAPLGHDFCCISLSDLLTPWEVIERRLEAAAAGDFCMALYNPASHRRRDHLRRACEVLVRAGKDPGTACGWVRNIGRAGQEARTLTLAELADAEVDMFTTVFVGSCATRRLGPWLVTPRGYEARAAKDARARGEGVAVASAKGAVRGLGGGATPGAVPPAAPAPLRVLVFGGTTEGRVLAERLAARAGFDACVSVATALGTEELEGPAACGAVRVVQGRLDEDGIARLAAGFDACVDATHPYAVEVSRNVRAACARAGVPVLRVARPGGDAADGVPADDGCVRVASAAEAAAFLAGERGSVLLAVGSKELPAFAGIDSRRLFARVLPTHEALQACEDLGLPHRNVLALQGPFTRAMNEAMLAQYGVSWLVTKDGGAAGGFAEKMEAARAAGARLVVVGRPVREEGLTVEGALGALEALRASRGDGAAEGRVEDGR